jgi:hypothetical protein
MTNAIRTFASKPFVVVAHEDRAVIGTSGNLAHARAIGASVVGENGYSIVDLSDVDGFCEAATGAHDIDGAIVAQYAGGLSCSEIARWLRDTKHSTFLRDETVAARIRRTCGGLSRTKARRQVAEWILAGAVG